MSLGMPPNVEYHAQTDTYRVKTATEILALDRWTVEQYHGLRDLAAAERAKQRKEMQEYYAQHDRRAKLPHLLREIIVRSPSGKQEARMKYMTEKLTRRSHLKRIILRDRMQTIGLYWAAGVGAWLAMWATIELLRVVTYATLR